MSLGIRLIAKCKKLSGLFMGVKDARKLAIGDEKLLSPNRISLATQDWWLKLAKPPRDDRPDRSRQRCKSLVVAAC